MSEAYSGAALTCTQSSRGFIRALTTAASATHTNPERTLKMQGTKGTHRLRMWVLKHPEKGKLLAEE